MISRRQFCASSLQLGLFCRHHRCYSRSGSFWNSLLFLVLSLLLLFSDGSELPADVKDFIQESEGPSFQFFNPEDAIGCGLGQFYCDKSQGGHCIPEKWVCDHEFDCNDRSDEPDSCPPQTCSPTQFSCKLTGKCIPLAYTCDRDIDCGVTLSGHIDSSDEEHPNCKVGLACPPNQHKCLTVDVCVDLDKFCDDHQDCPDFSDEGPFCSAQTTGRKPDCCKYGCKPTPDAGMVCFCPRGKSMKNKTLGICTDEDECTRAANRGFPPCSQICTNKDKEIDGEYFACTCAKGYNLAADKTTCKASKEFPEASVIFSNTHKLIHKDISLNKTLGSVSGYSLQAFDFDYKHRRLCWATKTLINHGYEMVINCTKILKNGSLSENVEMFLPEFQISGVQQLSFDWVSQNWYFLDDTYNRLFVCGSKFKPCIELSSGKMEKPKDMELDPSEGFIFLTDWGSRHPGLIRIDMDGSNMTYLVQSGIIHPFGLTLDYTTQTVYWVDSYLEYIRAIGYWGTEKRRHIVKGHQIKSFQALTEFESWLLATDQFHNRLTKVDKLNGSIEVFKPAKREYHKANTIRIFHQLRQPRVVHPCSEENGGCQHICLVSYDRKNSTKAPIGRCVCSDGFRLEKDNKTCVSALHYPFLLFGKTNPGTISGLPIFQDGRPEHMSARYQAIQPIRGLVRPAAMTFLVETGEIFFSDAGNFTISRQQIVPAMGEKSVKNRERRMVLDEGLSNCEGLAVDWISKNLYWSDEGLLAISATKLSNTTLRKVVVRGNLSHPRAVAVHPVLGFIFWADWMEGTGRKINETSAKIERADLDGSNRLAIIDQNIHWPNGLAIDLKGGWIFWSDAFLDILSSARLDGSDAKVIAHGSSVLHPYGVAYYQGVLYWSEFRLSRIMEVDVSNGTIDKEYMTLWEDTGPLFEVHVYDRDSQDTEDTGENNCSENNGGCSHFCFFSNSTGVVCSCADGFKSTEENGNDCQIDSAYTSPSPCDLSWQFECGRNKRCIDKKYLCDGDDDCGDGSDENNRPGGICEGKNCSDNNFPCHDNKCIPNDWLCDGDADCSSGEDEEVSRCKDEQPCGKDKFHCKVSGRCILLSWVCDYEPDCGKGDTSDEHSGCEYPVCTPDQFSCRNRQCIHSSYVCDGDLDCRDGSDEAHCDTRCVPGEEFHCEPRGCLSTKFQCDGIPDCAGGVDEKGCADNLPAGQCQINQFRCNTSGECIRGVWRCDGQQDCMDNSDEADCHEIICDLSTQVKCRDEQKCILAKWRCDGFEDCSDGSDEENCSAILRKDHKCVDPNWSCLNDTSICIEPALLCNGKNDCTDGSDEGAMCNAKICSETQKDEKRPHFCQHKCHDSPNINGYVCLCHKGFKLQPDRRTCAKENPCDVWGVCSQKCQPQGIHYFCYCEDGYEILRDKFTCMSTSSAKPYIVFSNRHELRLVGLRNEVSTSLAVNLRNSIAIDFYYVSENESYIFWTDIAADKISRGRLSNGALSEVHMIVEHGIATAEGIAVDWMGLNLYWVDSSLDQIEVSKLDGSKRATVVTGKMQNLRALTLDPREGLMFWTDWEESNPRIERCTLAGLLREEIFRVTDVLGGGWPNGLTTDYVARRLYWIDAKSDSIHTIDYQGKDHHQVLRGHDFLSHPFAITIFEDDVYWTDWRVNSILRANKWNGTSVKIIQGTSAQPFDIQVLHPSRQPPGSKNKCEKTTNGGCSHLCLINSTTSRICKCPYLMRLGKDNRTCYEVNEALLYAQPMAIVGVELEYPHPNYMPVLTSKFEENVSAMDVDVAASTVYWTDLKTKSILKAELNRSGVKTLIDSDLEHPGGLAVDWLSGNMYFTSWSEKRGEITVSTLDGEYRKSLILEGLQKPSSVALDPPNGMMYWIDTGIQPPAISSAHMDGAEQTPLNIEKSKRNNPTSLTLDFAKNRLYWVDRATLAVHFYDLARKKVHSTALPKGVNISLVAVNGSSLFYFDDTPPPEAKIGKLTLTENGLAVVGKPEIIRKVERVGSLRVFDKKLQKGRNKCMKSENPCVKSICVPKPHQGYRCLCAQGFEYVNSTKQCAGSKKVLLLAHLKRIRGLTVEENARETLAPIPQVALPNSVDYWAKNDAIVWADSQSEENQILWIRRDLTNRSVIVQEPKLKILSVAVDWVAENIYWSAKVGTVGVIEVARMNGSHRYVVVASETGSLRSVQLDPLEGVMFWLNKTGVQAAALDGSNRREIVSRENLTEIAIDRKKRRVCWLYAFMNPHSIGCSDYDGKNQKTLFVDNDNISQVSTFTISGNRLFWFDRKKDGGSVEWCVIKNDGTLDQKRIAVKKGMKLDIRDMTMFDAEEQKDGTNPCGENNGGCEQLCLFRGKNERVCKCSFAQVASDGKSCVAHKAFLAYSQSRSIGFASLQEEGDPNAPYKDIEDQNTVQNVVGLAFDFSTQRLFYSDIQLSVIMAVHFNGTKPQKIAIGVGSVEGLAFDYIHQDLYWTSYSNASISRAHVAVTEEYPIRPLKILHLSSNDKPRGIVVDPCDMRMYWTNWNEAKPRIERSFFSGYGRETVIQEGIRTPNALTIDFSANKLYWSDARLDKVERCELDGSNRVVLVSGGPNHPFGLVVYGNYLYWTDWIMRAVVRVNKFVGGDRLEYIRSNFTRQPMGIVAIAEDALKCGVDACWKKKPPCADLCMLTAAGEPYCACAGEAKLNPDNLTCSEPVSICKHEEFECGDGKCIPYNETCDGSKDCSDGTDESQAYCGSRKCRTGFLPCNNGMCVAESKKCDGHNDCIDYSDETMNCQCRDDQFKCLSGLCVDKEKRCDFNRDCNDASDEMDCPNRQNCSEQDIQGVKLIDCNSTTNCILPTWICDNYNDCWDNSDEENCTVPGPPTCRPNSFRCKGVENRCIPLGWQCDGEPDCVDGSDELGCLPVTCHPHNAFACSESGGQCISSTWKCDGNPDCPNGEDENELNCKDRNCTEAEFPCANGRCIPKQWVCDGENDCNDTTESGVGGSDENERNCNATGLREFCGDNQFQCRNGQCILNVFFCDADNDCGDWSDEPNNCLPRPCTAQEFLCRNKKCVPKTWTCNGFDDCGDNSDEDQEHCSTEIPCKKGQFQCKNKVCISESLVCDKRNDCNDWSDELSCGVDECQLNAGCEHDCVDDRIGFHCLCREGYKLDEDGLSCVDRNECLIDYPCSQICTNRIGSYQCSCDPAGYTLERNGRTCKHSDSVEPQILVSNRYYIWLHSLDGVRKSRILNNLTNAVAVDYDWLTQTVYWSDVTMSSSQIGSVSMNNTSGTFQIFNSILAKNPDGIAVDWAARNLYWCDKAEDTIEVAKLDGKYPALIHKGHPLQEPRAIVLDPRAKYLFWSDWGEEAHIGRMDMDGRNVHLIVKSSLRWPNALTLDDVTGHIFWGDAGQDYIGMCDYEGNGFRKVLSLGKEHHIFSMAVFEDYLYWTDWEQQRVERAHKYSGANRTVLIPRLTHRPMGIKIVHPILQRRIPKFQNPCDLLWCSNVCVLSRTNSSGFDCKCPVNFKRKGLLDCEADCRPSEFVCERTYMCLPFWWRCDGQNDCGDWQDEMYRKEDTCPKFECQSNQYQCLFEDPTAENRSVHCVVPMKICDGKLDCPLGDDEGRNGSAVDCSAYQCLRGQYKCNDSGICIPKSKRCDGKHDCPNMDDEENCPARACGKSEFQCATVEKRCIPAVFVCDGEADCSDGSDEADDCVKKNCSALEFQCRKSHGCILAIYVCDGKDDCGDGEDEDQHYCQNRKCDSRKQFKCKTGRCIPKTWVCDGDPDCENDEENCNATTTCLPGSQFQCVSDRRCISINWRCDGEYDCEDRSDEDNCDEHAVKCRQDEYPCHDGRRCIDTNLTCNGLPDCDDKSDEFPKNHQCAKEASKCWRDQFECNSTSQCIPNLWKCDGDADCFDGSDEEDCEAPCGAGQFRCNNGLCIKDRWTCDGMNDCGDEFDEVTGYCRVRACAPSFRKCASGHCYPSHLHCDGVDHCRDGSDENNNHTCKAGKSLDKCEFQCSNGHCIGKKYLCDGFDDCADGSDELSCADNRCQEYGTCSQKCDVLMGNTVSCYCADGYSEDRFIKDGRRIRATSCRVEGDVKPVVILAVNQEIRFLIGGAHYDTLRLKLGTSARSTDFVYLTERREPYLYWTDPHKGKVWRAKIPDLTKDDEKRRKREAQDSNGEIEPEEIFGSVKHPIGLAIDWVNENVYWTDSGTKTIDIGRLDGRIQRTLFAWNLQEPHAIVVAPEKMKLFWTDVGQNAKIEVSQLDGSKRKIMISKNILYPTGLALDSPNERLYWADMKTGSIETSAFDGRDRRLVKSFGFKNGLPQERPMYLDVFENRLFVSTYPLNAVFSMDKFYGKEPVDEETHVLIQEGLPHSADVSLFHPVKQSEEVASPCKDSADVCYVDALCVPSESEDGGQKPTCLCSTSHVYSTKSKRCAPEEFTIPRCPLACENNGTCVMSLTAGRIICKCPPLFTGDRCQINKCQGLCLNGGDCYVDERNNNAASCNCPLDYDGDRCQRYKCTGFCSKNGFCFVDPTTSLPRCRCDRGWAGDRCGQKAEACQDYCFNDGVCELGSLGRPYCRCPRNVAGPRCEHCRDQSHVHRCENGGYCSEDSCVCKPGFFGDHCQRDKCRGYCMNNGECVRSASGVKCQCSPGFAGEKCQRDKCDGYCQNGGICKHHEQGPVCLCPTGFSGPHCEQKENCDKYCVNGTCTVDKSGNYACKCDVDFYGKRCDLPIPCRAFCSNGARCSLLPNGTAVCHCPQGLGGSHCRVTTAESCEELVCHEGVCYGQISSRQPACHCRAGWTGLVCNLPTCNRYCHNGGSCSIEMGEAACRCKQGFSGDRCETAHVTSENIEDNMGGTIAAIVVPLILIVVFGVLILYIIFVRRKRSRGQFKHRRMGDEDEIHNPVFLHGEDEEGMLADEATNFTNPMYENVYNDTVTTAAPGTELEDQGLLARSRLEMKHEDFD